MAEEDLDVPDLSKVPLIYLDPKEIFNERRASPNPPHRP